MEYTVCIIYDGTNYVVWITQDVKIADQLTTLLALKAILGLARMSVEWPACGMIIISIQAPLSTMKYIAAGKQPETCIPESSSQSSSHGEPTTKIIYRSLEKFRR